MFEIIQHMHWYIAKEWEYPGINKLLTDLQQESRLSQKQWLDFQMNRLRQLLIAAGENVPYYRKMFHDINFIPQNANLPEELSRIPLLTKKIIKERQNDLVSDNVIHKKLIKNATGGSTGNPLTFYQDQFYQTVSTALDAFVRSWWGIKPYDKTALIWGADRDFGELSLKERIYTLRSRTKGLNAFRMNDENLLKFCMVLRKWKAPYLMGYSSALEEMAKYVIDKGIDDLKFKAIRSTAEMLWPKQREIITKAFNNSPVYNFYGSREINNIAAECEYHHLHLASTWRYLEVVDSDGCPVLDGKVGEFAVTDLSNFSMPFIRYINEDAGRIVKNTCKCGRPSPTIKELLGRSSDLIRSPDGDIIHGEFFTHLFYGISRVKRFQVHQDQIDNIVVKYVASDNLPMEIKQELCEKIKKQVGDSVKVKFVRCDNINIPPSGKHRFTISDIR